MSRTPGDFSFPNTLERAVPAPLDATTYCPTLADMLNHSFGASLYEFIEVTVYNDPNPSNNGIYKLVNVQQRTLMSGWEKVVERSEIEQANSRIDNVEQVQIPAIQNNITNIAASVSNLQSTQAGQQQAISQLSDQVASAINNPQVGSVAAAVQVLGQPFPQRPDALVVHWYTWDMPPLDPNHPYDQWFNIPEIIEGEPAVPNQFQGFQWNVVNNGTGGSVQLSISSLPVSNPSITSIQYRVNEGSPVNLGSISTPLSQEITGLTDNTVVEFQIRAVNGIGAGEWSLVRTVTPTLITQNDVPNPFVDSMWGLTDDETGTSLTVSVNVLPTSIPAITSIQYRIKNSMSGTYSSETTAPISAIGTFQITGLTTGIGYDVQIRALNAEGASTWSDEKTETPTEIVATPPQAFTLGMWNLANVGDGETARVTINSLPSSQPAITSIQYRLDGGSATNAPISGVGFFDISPLNNPSYNVEIRALNSAGAGAWSDIKNVVLEEFSGIIQIAAQNDFSGGGNCTFSTPSEIQSGDLVVVTIAGDSNSNTIAPAGFIEAVQSQPSSNVNPSAAIYYKVATGSEPSNYVFNKTSPTVGSLILYRGVDASNPVVGVATTSGGNFTSSPTIPGEIPYGGTNTEHMLVATLCQSSSGSGPEIEFTPPANFTVIGNLTGPAGANSFLTLTQVHTSATANTPNINVSTNLSSGRRFAACQLLLRKA